jgi:hypothetical protein
MFPAFSCGESGKAAQEPPETADQGMELAASGDPPSLQIISRVDRSVWQAADGLEGRGRHGCLLSWVS